MPKPANSLVFTLLSLILFVTTFAISLTAQTTIKAASCNESDVAAAIAQATTDGDIVSIPAGNCTWTTALQATMTNSITIEGAGAKTPQGGTDQTIIQDGTNHSTNDIGAFNVNTVAGKSFRLTGIAFYYSSSNSSVTWHGVLQINGNSQSVRIDHCHFYQLHNKGIALGATYGVIDHCLFDMVVADAMALEVEGAGTGDASWADTDHFGSNEFMFAEDNTFQFDNTSDHGFAFDCDAGGRIVFRYNTVGPHVALQTHGTGSGDNLRGCRNEEVYDNTFTWSSDPTNDNFAFLQMLEGGAGLFWGNTITGFVQFINEDVVRANTSSYGQITAAPNGWGMCGTTYGPSPWDGNTNSTGYPCLDQVGRGKGDLLTEGEFPNIVNSTTGTITWPHQALDPIYVWSNTYNPVPQESNDALWSNNDSISVENRDYYLQLPNYEESATFNGKQGVGQGAYTNMPSTCTPLVAYWATDKNTLYQCTATNTWTAYYTPYTYPHPLDTSQTATAPNPPTALSAAIH